MIRHRLFYRLFPFVRISRFFSPFRVHVRPKKGKTISGKAYVTDADDIKVNGIKIRLHGIDAPEYRQLAKRKGTWYDQGKWSKIELIKEIGGKRVKVKVAGFDKFGRTLGVVFHDGKDICGWMVQNGLAIAAYDDKYKSQEHIARRKKLGVWGDEISYSPVLYKHGVKKRL